MRQRVTLVTAGDPRRLTGGNLFNRYVLQALHQAGLYVEAIVLPLDRPAEAASVLREDLVRQEPALVVVDSIALETVAPFAGWVRQRLKARLLALMHMLPSDLVECHHRRALRCLEYQLLTLSDHIVTVSDCLAHRIAALTSGNRITVIMPGKDGVPLEEADQSGRNGLRFLCVANWSPAKGIHTLIEALARLSPNTELDLIGAVGDGAYAGYIRDLIHWNLLDERVRIHGPLQGMALARRYASADVFVLPSASESFGIAYAEAMTFGLPVVGCRIGPLLRLAEGGCGILVPVDDAGALASAMQGLVDDCALRTRMGGAASCMAASLPTWRDSSEQFAHLVRGLLGERCAPLTGS